MINCVTSDATTCANIEIRLFKRLFVFNVLVCLQVKRLPVSHWQSSVVFEMSLRHFMIGFISSTLSFGLCYVFLRRFLSSDDFNLTQLRYKNFQHARNISSELSRFGNYDTSMADDLFDKVKIVCLLVTISDHHRRKADHVRDTWGKRCNKIIFMTNTADSALGLNVAIRVKNSRKLLWPKTRESFKYVYHNHLNDGDWFLKADDDT